MNKLSFLHIVFLICFSSSIMSLVAQVNELDTIKNYNQAIVLVGNFNKNEDAKVAYEFLKNGVVQKLRERTRVNAVIEIDFSNLSEQEQQKIKTQLGITHDYPTLLCFKQGQKKCIYSPNSIDIAVKLINQADFIKIK